VNKVASMFSIKFQVELVSNVKQLLMLCNQN